MSPISVQSGVTRTVRSRRPHRWLAGAAGRGPAGYRDRSRHAATAVAGDAVVAGVATATARVAPVSASGAAVAARTGQPYLALGGSSIGRVQSGHLGELPVAAAGHEQRRKKRLRRGGRDERGPTVGDYCSVTQRAGGELLVAVCMRLRQSRQVAGPRRVAHTGPVADAPPHFLVPRPAGRAPRYTGHPYLFRGLITCGPCDRKMVGNPNHGRLYCRCTASRDSPPAPAQPPTRARPQRGKDRFVRRRGCAGLYRSRPVMPRDSRRWENRLRRGGDHLWSRPTPRGKVVVRMPGRRSLLRRIRFRPACTPRQCRSARYRSPTRRARSRQPAVW